jgi:hypothetical protein
MYNVLRKYFTLPFVYKSTAEINFLSLSFIKAPRKYFPFPVIYKKAPRKYFPFHSINNYPNFTRECVDNIIIYHLNTCHIYIKHFKMSLHGIVVLKVWICLPEEYRRKEDNWGRSVVLLTAPSQWWVFSDATEHSQIQTRSTFLLKSCW